VAPRFPDPEKGWGSTNPLLTSLPSLIFQAVYRQKELGIKAAHMAQGIRCIKLAAKHRVADVLALPAIIKCALGKIEIDAEHEAILVMNCYNK
jgi:hypothetical protein